jgi:hypothetical protein
MSARKSVAIIQSSYIPWKGYFDIINDVDEFIFLDDVQFTAQDWRSRNRIKTANGPLWLSVPAGTDIRRRICDVRLMNTTWQKKHWKSIFQNYVRAPHFTRYSAFFEEVYIERRWESLSEMNQFITERIAKEFLGIKSSFKDSREYLASGTKQARLIDLIQKSGASHYVSGPAASAYIDENEFTAAGITLSYKEYSGYPEYQQAHPPFEHAVSILDLLFNVGQEAPDYIWGWRDRQPQVR